jgi:hypothetical protein
VVPVKRPVTLRICGPADERALRWLARRDTQAPLEGTILAAEVEDKPLAAICLETGRVVADPFSHTAALVDLLRTRAAEIERVENPQLRQSSPVLSPQERRSILVERRKAKTGELHRDAAVIRKRVFAISSLAATGIVLITPGIAVF